MASEDPERRNTIPVLYTSGTYYEVGFDVGRTFRGLIQDYLGPSTWLHETLLPAYETEAGRATYDETLAALKENYPQYVREVQGTADGAQVPFHHLMLLNMEKSVTAEAHWKEVYNSSVHGCSDLSINMNDQVLLGHTEDTYRDMMNLLYIVSATISEEEPQGKLGIRQESFTSLCYPGHLPGYTLGYNHHGLVFSINVIIPLKVLPVKTPRLFLCRALLSATSAEAAHSILRDRGTGVADGFSVNMIFMKEKGTHDFQIVEVGPPQGGRNESELSIVPVEVGQHFFHANKYLHLTTVPEQNALNITSSDRRAARASQFPAPKNLEDMLEVLSDKKDPSFPIFREGSVEGASRTMSVGVFDVLKRTWTTWMRNPKKAAPLMQIPLHFNWDT